MDIVASIFAYLGCVGGIVTALTIAVSVLLSAPAPSTAATAPKAPFVTSGQKHDRIDSDKTKFVARALPTSLLSKKQILRMKDLRRLALQQRAKRLADQESSDFEARFKGYIE